MNFAITWLFDKLGYMPKIDMQVGKVRIDTEAPEFKMWPFPAEQEKPKKQVKKVVKKATTVSKKATNKKPLETKFVVGKPKAIKKANKRLKKAEQ
jgi:hypothetical protein